MGSLFAARITSRRTLLGVTGALLGGCDLRRQTEGPSIEFTRIPQADQGGREKHDIIEGRVQGARAGQQIVLYAKSGVWWVQPLADQPFTPIQENSKWSNATHLGTEYAALLVDSGFSPPATIRNCLRRGGGVVATVVTPGASNASIPHNSV